MKKLIQFLVAAGVLLVAACQSNGTPQEQPVSDTDATQTSMTIDKPAAFEQQEYHIPNELRYPKQKFDFIYDKFRPIGWSANGKFAYISEPADEACGCYFFELKIVDTRSDKIVYEFVHNDEGTGETLSSMWDKHYKEFEAKLWENEIVQGPRIEMLNEEFSYNDKNFGLKLKVDRKKDQDFQVELVKHYSLNIISGNAKKQLANANTDSISAIVNMSVAGVLQNPYEARVAVLLQEENLGYEGPPNVLKLRIIGAALDKGFE